jgi:sialic acid synthase SpsE
LPEKLNLICIPKLREKFGLEVGYSNHNPDIIFCIAAVALGASMIEFHITLSRKMWGTDQSSSLEPQEAGLLVKSIRNIEKSLGKNIY